MSSILEGYKLVEQTLETVCDYLPLTHCEREEN